MNCDEVEDILGAYALDALPGELSADVTAHLATCSKHPEAAELRAVAGALAFAAPEAQPSAALKTRLLDALREESEPADAAPRRIGTAPTGEALAVVRADLNAIESLAVTIEPAGGSIAPTTDPVLEGKV